MKNIYSVLAFGITGLSLATSLASAQSMSALSPACQQMSGKSYEIKYRGDGAGWSRFQDYTLRFDFEKDGSGMKVFDNYGIDMIVDYSSNSHSMVILEHAFGFWGSPYANNNCEIDPERCFFGWTNRDHTVEAIQMAKRRMDLVPSQKSRLPELAKVLACAEERVRIVDIHMNNQVFSNSMAAVQQQKGVNLNVGNRAEQQPAESSQGNAAK